ncbi:BTB/POZ domain-containing protein 3-like [Paramacrobiotus metropolitanus]|uniref:BTB/POZ domain-containing protein 3-like n=1 Tax=Paramacrobiotus metropolitanus TaxID=2943436 RepID=UPI00244648D9|nr:BTB/POZ domain-containing protein 3-like [Paramacrobiotus metropolitanus]
MFTLPADCRYMSQKRQSTAQSSDAEGSTKMAKLGDYAKNLLLCEDTSDVRFRVGRDYGAVKIFPAHRVIMGRSPVFHTMFYGSLPDKRKAPISIPDVLPEAFSNMLSFIYTDAVQTLTKDNVFPTLGCADKYDLPLLVAMCTDFVLKDLTISNCLDILDDAVHYDSVAPSILEECLYLIDESPKLIWESEQFSAIGHEALRTILQRDTLTASEDRIWLSVDKWAENMCTRRNLDSSAASRREILGQTLFLIRFPLLTSGELLDGPVKRGLLLKSEERDIFHHKNAAIKPQLPFRTDPRQNVRAVGVINFTIPDVRKVVPGEPYAPSDRITLRNLLWCIYVKNDTDSAPTAFGFYLWCYNPPKSATWNCQVHAELRLLPWKAGTAPIKKTFSRLYCKQTSRWGLLKYIFMEELLDPANGYVNPADFSLTLQIEMTAELPTGMM